MAEAADPRGRTARGPRGIPARGWKDVMWRVKDEVSDDEVGFVAAGVAFYAMLALFPALAAALSLYGLFADPGSVQNAVSQLTALPEAVRQLLSDQVSRLASQKQSALTVGFGVGLLLTLYSATKGTKALMEAMNVAYDEDDDRGFLRQNLVAFGLTLLLVASGCIALALLVGLPSLTEILGLRASWMQWGLNVVAWVLIAGLAIGTLAAVYRFAPNRDDAQWRWITPGAALALGIWLVASLLFSLYVANFGKYGETYGSLAAVVILLMWLWVSAYVVILGAEVNAEAEHQTREDTTTGPRERMGRRGAHVADTLGEAR